MLSVEASKESEAIKRTPLRVRLSGIPRDGSYYAKAKEAEQRDQLEKADKYFLMEISHKRKHFKSAIKDLANLKNRMGKSKEAITLLDKYRDAYDGSELDSLDQMKIQFFVKGQQYHEAAGLLAQIAKNTHQKNKRTEYLRQEAYCYYAAGEFNNAIKKLEALPKDSAVTALLTKINRAIEDGVHGKISKELVDDEPLSSLALGLSSMARKHLDKCEFKGTDERSRERGLFQQSDYDQIKKLLDNIKGRRPRDQAEYLLSLAALCEKVPDFEQHTQMHTHLMWYFAKLAEAAMSENFDKDVVRCYCIESLRFHAPFPRKKLEDAWALLLGTYLVKNIRPSVLLEKVYDGNYGKPLFGLFKENPKDWEAFLNDAPYYKLHVPVAFEAIEMHIKESGLPIEVKDKIEEERKRNKSIDSVFRWISKSSFSIDYLRTTQERLAECSKHVRLSLDRERLKNATNIYKQCSEYLLERDFREREANYLRLDSEIVRILEEIDKMPTVLSFERLYPTLKSLQDSLQKDFKLLEDSIPELELRNVLDNDFYVLNNDGRVSLRLLLESKNESTPPIEAISLALEYGESDPCHSPEPLCGGQRKEIELNIKPTKKEIKDNAFTIQTVVEYRTRRGEKTEKSHPFPIAVRLGTPDSFEKIPNPYGRYSGGSPVDEDSMFFGRSDLIDRIIQYISTGESGQCFVLYGQKRSGKSSVLSQIKKRVSEAVFFVKISAGDFSTENLWSSFARLLVQEMKFQLEDIQRKVPENWPNQEDVANNPTEKIREVTRLIKRMDLNIVVAVDEFTYIYEMARDDAEVFMRGWKALLEAKAFNAILVGQDTMPRFKQAFPNEFGITHDERLTYLKKAEADSLASQPILFDGKTRYRGRALEKMFDLTAGSPYYLQITCDKLVQHLNNRRAAFITEADIDHVAHTLTVGTEALTCDRFNALVTAAGEKVDIIPQNDLWQLLERLARESLRNGWCYRNILAEISHSDKALKDLIDREIIVPKGDRVSIRVGLFAKWLRANQYQLGNV